MGQQSRQEPTIGHKILITQDMLLFMEIRPLEILDYILVRFALSDARFARCLGIDENNHVKNQQTSFAPNRLRFSLVVEKSHQNGAES